MASLWRNFGVKELCDLLAQQDPTLLSRLERMLPALSGGGYNPAALYLPATLAKLVESFVSSEAFADSGFRRACLNRLPPEELAACAARLGLARAGYTFDSLREAVAAAKWTPAFAKGFLDYFELPDHFLPHTAEPVPDQHVLEPNGGGYPDGWVRSPLKRLQPYQQGVYAAAGARLQVPRSRFVIQMPTGAGKTRTAMELVCDQLNADPDCVVVWLAHVDELCEQAFQCFLDVWYHLGRSTLSAYRSWGRHSLPRLQPGRPSFIVAGFQKFHAALKKDGDDLAIIGARNALTIVDEAHKTEAPTYKRVVLALLGDSTKVVGLTATPGRSIISEVERLSDFYFGEKVGIDVPDGSSVIQVLRDIKVLARAQYVPILTGIDVELSTSQKRALAERFDLPSSVLQSLGGNEIRNIEIVKRLAQDCRAGRRILFFACSVAHSVFIASTLLYFGYKAGHIDGTTSGGRRRELVEGFRSGKLQVLCNFGVLATGFDAPATDVVFIARPTASPVVYSQMIGRGLRGPAIGGTETCAIVDVRDNIVGFGDASRIYEMFDEYWDN